MRLIKNVEEIEEWREGAVGKVGFVPTMGFLHEGHLALVERAREECDEVVVSIFVNPEQFDDKEDLEKYPRDLDQDLEMLEEAGVDVVFVPEVKGVYPDGYEGRELELGELGNVMCGKTRPGHFDGVVKVLDRLFEVVRPDSVFFGQKDLQQCLVVEKMIEYFGLGIEMMIVDTVRDERGVAMSSRNVRLSEDGLEKVSEVAQILCSGEVERLDDVDGVKFDYIEEIQFHGGVAVAVAFWVEGVRLIDNVIIEGYEEYV